MGYIYEKSFPVNAKDYEVYEEVGEGVSATVYRALCIPLNVPVAVKVLDLEKCSNDSLLASIRREVHTMSSLDHPNVLRAYCSFTNDHKLWVVMPYMNGGSCLHIMKSTHPEGFEESVIATLLYEVLKALAYLHAHGYIHRDVKAGNILIDSNGAVKLADFGVSACMFDTGDRQRSRNTFVGTPCWMAPEVMQQLHGYDFKADIWSFGITALELARGHAPFSKYPPMKVLLMTLQNAPPGLDYKRDNRFSKHFKDMVAACLVKDPKKRPSSEKLLKNRFFQKARSNEFIAKTLLQGLSPLGDRLKTLKAKESELLVQNKAINGDKEKLSQQEYIRGISGWNFNLEDYKNDTSLDYDGDEEKPSFERVSSTLSLRQEIKLNDFQNAESLSSPLSVSPTEELHADDTNVRSPKRTDIIQSESKPPFQLQLSPKLVDEATNKTCDENSYRNCSTPHNVDSGDNDKTVTSLPPENIISPSRKINGNEDRENVQSKYHLERNISVGDISEGTIIRRKGRFKVTSEDLSPKGTPILSGHSSSEFSTGIIAPPVLAASVMPSLQSILLQNNVQREALVKLIKSVDGTSEFADVGTIDVSQISPGSARERELQALVAHLQQSNDDLGKELQRMKAENAQLEGQVKALSNKDDEGISNKSKA